MAANRQSDDQDTKGDGTQDRLRHLSTGRRLAAYAPSYSIRVRQLRIVLPLVAIFTVAIVILWPKIRAEFHHPTETSQEERQAKMVNGRFVGSDAHGRPYTITYDSALQPPQGGPIDMVNPIAELTLENGRWLAVKAEKARYDQQAGTIDLSGNVELFHDAGYRFMTQIAHVEINKNLIWGERFVSGRGPKGEVQGRGFRVINNGDAVVVTGPARLLMRPDAAQMAEPTEVASKPEEVFKKKR
ncbi:MAG TPA: LPS export ABC transporter periplasmic protein LptC [Alphaproteobacteria bacterium]|nr:LPS export ABC transporter periplasmic protein LptC [Alphaproteobacteria bacterium]